MKYVFKSASVKNNIKLPTNCSPTIYRIEIKYKVTVIVVAYITGVRVQPKQFKEHSIAY